MGIFSNIATILGGVASSTKKIVAKESAARQIDPALETELKKRGMESKVQDLKSSASKSTVTGLATSKAKDVVKSAAEPLLNKATAPTAIKTLLTPKSGGGGVFNYFATQKTAPLTEATAKFTKEFVNKPIAQTLVAARSKPKSTSELLKIPSSPLVGAFNYVATSLREKPLDVKYTPTTALEKAWISDEPIKGLANSEAIDTIGSMLEKNLSIPKSNTSRAMETIALPALALFADPTIGGGAGKKIAKDLIMNVAEGISKSDSFDEVLKVTRSILNNRNEEEVAKVANEIYAKKADPKMVEEILQKRAAESSVPKTPETISTKIDAVDKSTPEQLKASMEKKVEEFRKEAGLKAVPYEGIGRVEYETPNGIFSSFSLGKTKSNMVKQVGQMRKEADNILYENDPAYKAMRDAYDQKIANKTDSPSLSYKVPDFDEPVIKEIDTPQQTIARNIENSLDIKVPAKALKTEEDIVVASSKKLDKATGIEKFRNVTAKNIYNTVRELEKRTTELKLLKQRIKDRTKSVAKIRERNDVISALRADRSKSKVKIAENKKSITKLENSLIKSNDTQAVNYILANYLKKNLPLEERGRFITQLRDIKSTEGEEKLLDILERIDERSAELAEAKALTKDMSRAKSTIAFIKKIGDMGGAVSKEVKAAVGIESWDKASVEQLQQAVGEFKKRLKFAYDSGFLIPTVPPSSVTPQMVEQVRKGVGMTGKEVWAAKFAKNKEAASDMTKKILQPIYDKLNDISPEIAIRMRNFEQTTRTLSAQRLERISPVVKKFNELAKNKMAVEDWRELDYALKNRMQKNVDTLVDKYGIRAEYDEAKKVLAEIVSEGKNYDKNLGELTDYWPRSIQWSDELAEKVNSKYGNILAMALRKREETLKRALTQADKEAVLNQLLRGFRQEGVSISKAGSAKERMIDVIPPEWNKYYKDSSDALVDYVQSMTEYIEQKKLFGQFILNKEALKEMDASETIGHFVMNLLVEGRVTDKEADAIKDVLVARFNSKSPGAFINTLKNIGYIETMGSIFNAASQVADLGISGYQNGWFRTLGKAISPKKIKLEDLAINKFEDLLNQGNAFTSQVVKKIFDANLISFVDRLTKETNINAAVSRWKSMASSPKKEAALLRELRKISLEADIPKIMDGLKKDELNQEIKMALFNHLSKSQPISLGEYPEAYLKMSNGKVFYMLKSYQIKQLNMIRNEVIDEIKNGKGKISAMKKLIALTTSLGLANATVSEIKDFMSGKETKFSDNLVSGITKIYFYNRYLESKLKTGGISGALQSQLGFPTRSADTVTKALFSGKFWDVIKKDLPRSTPLIGEPYYWWFGEGYEKQKVTVPKKKTTTTAKQPVKKVPIKKQPVKKVPIKKQPVKKVVKKQ